MAVKITSPSRFRSRRGRIGMFAAAIVVIVAGRPAFHLVRTSWKDMDGRQDRTDEGERAMRQLTRELIDAALASGGRYYLPYRLHATKKQFRQAYPQAGEFFAAKRLYDSDELFQNEFYRAYGM